MSSQDPFLAAAVLLSTLAQATPPSDEVSEDSARDITKEFNRRRLQLPGEVTPGKKAFVTELEKLMRRVYHLEKELVSNAAFFPFFFSRLSLLFLFLYFALASMFFIVCSPASHCHIQLIHAFVLAAQETPQVEKTQTQIR